MISPSLPRFIRRLMLKMVFSKIMLGTCQAVANYIAQDMETETGPAVAQLAA